MHERLSSARASSPVRGLLVGVMAACASWVGAHAQGYRPPFLTEVVRSDAGSTAHLQVTVTIPKLDPEWKFGAITQVVLYGWLSDGKNRLNVGNCAPQPREACPYGFPIKSGFFGPGEITSVEVDLPRAFVDAEGAEFYVGIGNEAHFIPSPNLLVASDFVSIRKK